MLLEREKLSASGVAEVISTPGVRADWESTLMGGAPTVEQFMLGTDLLKTVNSEMSEP